MKKELTYDQKIFEYLDRMPACIKTLGELCVPENQDKFISVVKAYIDEKGSGTNGYVVEFSSDFTAIKKFDLIL